MELSYFYYNPHFYLDPFMEFGNSAIQSELIICD